MILRRTFEESWAGRALIGVTCTAFLLLSACLSGGAPALAAASPGQPGLGIAGSVLRLNSEGAPAPSGVFGEAGYLYGNCATSDSDGWAVGNGASGMPFAEHWNGQESAPVTTPNPTGSKSAWFMACVDISPDDVWAVGTYYGDGGDGYPLVEHWDGSSWSLVDVPDVDGSEFTVFRAVSASAPDDVWAVGNSQVGAVEHTLVEHFDGNSWSIVTTPGGGRLPSGEFTGVTSLSPTNVWAVGLQSQDIHTYDYPLSQHWNGHKWNIVKTPGLNPAKRGAYLPGNAWAVSGKNIWAVGVYTKDWMGGRSFTMRWNGRHWAIVDTPNPGPDGFSLNSVVASGRSDVWISGYETLTGGSTRPVAIHFNGSSWTKTRAPNPENNSRFEQIAPTGSGKLFAAGVTMTPGYLTLTEVWTGKKWKVQES